MSPRQYRLDVWAPLPLSAHLPGPRRSLPFPLDDPGCRLFSKGRQALWQGVRAIGLQPGDEVLAPAYHHGSEIEALGRAGLVCRFYDAQVTLEPDPNELEWLMGPRTRALHITHYMGFPQDAEHWRRWCDERDLLLIEDAAPGWLATHDGTPVGTHGDTAIFSLYKTFGFPDGGAVIARRAVAEPTGPPPSARHELGVRTRAWLVQRLPGRPLTKPVPPEYDPAEDFGLGNPSTAASQATRRLLPRVADPAAAEARRSNYRFLLRELGSMTPPPFHQLPAGASPFAFPIIASNSRAFADWLTSQGIGALDFWSVRHPVLPPRQFPGAAQRRGSTVVLPVHQELEARHLDQIVETVRAAGNV